MNSDSEPRLILTSLPTLKKIVAISAGQGLLPANLHHMMKVVILIAETEFRPRVAWETTL